MVGVQSFDFFGPSSQGQAAPAIVPSTSPSPWDTAGTASKLVTAEKIRAQAAENANTAAITTETARATTAEAMASQAYNVKSYGAKGDGTTDDTAAIQNAMNAAGPTGATVYFPPGVYIISSPLTWDKSAATSAIECPALVGVPGRGGKNTDSGGNANVTTLSCSNSFPVGEFAIDYIGAQNAALIAPYVAGLQILCNSRAAGIRCVNQNGGIWERIDIYNSATPAPANNVGGPSAAFNFLNSGNSWVPYNNIARDLLVKFAGKDGFSFSEGSQSGLVAYYCESLDAARYGFMAWDQVDMVNCIDTGAATAGFYLPGRVTLVGCKTNPVVPTTGAAVWIVGGSTSTNLTELLQTIVGCHFYTNPSSPTTMVQLFGHPHNAVFQGCTFAPVGTGTVTNYVTLDSGASGTVKFNDCMFVPNGSIPASPYSLSTTGVVQFHNCTGLTPMGSVSVSVPSSGTATTPQPFPCTFYITAGASSMTVTISGGGVTVTIPANACVPVRVPASCTLTPTYTNAPTWVVEGE